MTPGLETVLTELTSAGFVQIDVPLQVAGATFEFEAAVIGTGVSHDLVVMATGETDHQRLVRLTDGLSRALDHVGSRRPVTLVLIGQAPTLALRDDLERNVRLLLVNDDNIDVSLVRRAIAVLMPLALPTSQGEGKDPITEVLKALGSSNTLEHLALIQAAQSGADEVRSALKGFIDQIFEDDAEELGAL